MSKEAMKLALEAVYETIIQWDEGGGKRSRRELARRIVALAEQPAQQEPVAWIDVKDTHHGPYEFHGKELLPVGKHDLYTSPPAQRKPLTDEVIFWEYQRIWPFHPAEEPRLAADLVTFARAIEAAHGIKENT